MSLIDSQNSTEPVLDCKPTKDVLQSLQNVSTIICANYRQCISMLYLGSYCCQSNITICWSTETLLYYRSFDFVH